MDIKEEVEKEVRYLGVYGAIRIWQQEMKRPKDTERLERLESMVHLAKEYLKRPTEEPKEGYRWVQNLMTGRWVQEPVDTPWHCSVGSETYWSS
jgi:hypothetical protein